ncbi:uncharacterized protein PFL1_05907 [Pseudozyma flocculosa PF-1]|uniref:Uncharacterized protein n=1 Tax=Pseudozyma flocculosa PF-1 TaxID=1277687 RepID=A0A061H7M4_9BASI|nr:uncharacterized protein PFL1_05907 [Pseudozyma flocculosa PF-1]EPQ26586.1 hypothetical protein PFL1_05907 [Pseudozyma flocculosa PF-1]
MSINWMGSKGLKLAVPNERQDRHLQQRFFGARSRRLLDKPPSQLERQEPPPSSALASRSTKARHLNAPAPASLMSAQPPWPSQQEDEEPFLLKGAYTRVEAPGTTRYERRRARLLSHSSWLEALELHRSDQLHRDDVAERPNVDQGRNSMIQDDELLEDREDEASDGDKSSVESIDLLPVSNQPSSAPESDAALATWPASDGDDQTWPFDAATLASLYDESLSSSPKASETSGRLSGWSFEDSNLESTSRLSSPLCLSYPPADFWFCVPVSWHRNDRPLEIDVAGFDEDHRSMIVAAQQSRQMIWDAVLGRPPRAPREAQQSASQG